MTIEHIAARRGEENVEKCLLDLSAEDTRHAVEEDRNGGGTTLKNTKKVNLVHHLGNLVMILSPQMRERIISPSAES